MSGKITAGALSMGKSCCAVGCANRYSKDSGIPFYRFPTDAERRAFWISAVNRKDWMPNEHSWICGAHFITGCKSNDPVSPDFIPSVFDYVKSPQKRKLINDIERYDRTLATKKRRMDNAAAAESRLVSLADDGTSNGLDFLEPHTGAFTSTILSISEIEKLESRTRLLEKENSKLKEENECLLLSNHALKEQLNNLQGECRLLKESECMLSQEWFEGNDAKVKYYTGLPNFVTLLAIYNFFAPYIEITNRSVLSPFQQLMIALMKLHLNLGDQDLSFRFGVNQSTISRCFNKMICVLYIRLKPLIKWPERSVLLKTMPMEFRHNFRSCVTIIDCFEVFMERPTNVKARAQTWSSYKHHNTAKFLIGIAPQGVITFISRGWGGRVSDVHITENCGILENLMQGDLILADRI